MGIFGMSNYPLDADLSPCEHYGHESYREPKPESFGGFGGPIDRNFIDACYSGKINDSNLGVAYGLFVVFPIVVAIIAYCVIICVLAFKIEENAQEAKTPQTTKYTDTRPQQPQIVFTRADVQAIKGMNDPTLNRYLRDFNILYKEYKSNFPVYFVDKILWGHGNRSIEKLLRTKVYYDYDYARITGTKNPTFANYERLLQQYQRDSINARYKQLRNQANIIQYNQRYRTK